MNRTMEFGIRIGADGKVAVIEARRVDDAFKQVNNTVNQTSKQFQQNEISTKQMSAALRGVPAQFTDIFTSLAAGQNPMQVFLQQGGQLKDMFGGAGPAAKALGGYVVGLINPLTLTAAAVGTLAVAYESGRRELEAMATAIIVSGNAAGTTVSQMAAITAAVNGTRGAAAEVVTQLVATGKIGADSLQRITDVALQMDRLGGPAIDDTVKAFASLGDKPVTASLKLNEQTNYLTAAVYAQIKALADQGKESQAAMLAQNAYADALAERTPKMIANLGLIESKWLSLKAIAGGMVDTIKSIGRDDSAGETLLAAYRQLQGMKKSPEWFTPEQLALAEKAVQLARQAYLQEQQTAGLDTQRKENLSAEVKWDAIILANLSKQQQEKRAIAEIDNAYFAKVKAAGGDQQKILAATVQYETALATIREKNADKSETAYASLIKSSREYSAELASAITTGTKLTKAETDLLKAYQLKGSAISAADKALLQSNVQSERAADLAKQLNKDLESSAKGYADYTLNMVNGVALINPALDEEIARIDAATQSLLGNEAAARDHIVTLALQKAGLEEGSDAWREYGEKLRQALSNQDQAKAQKALQDGWQRSFEQAGQSLSDEIMRGGKSGGELLEDYFSTLVLKPMIQGGVNAVLGIGGSGAAGGAASGGGMSLLSGASSAWSAFSNSGLVGGASALAGSYGAGLTAAAAGTDLTAAIAAYEAAGMSGVAAGLSAGASTAGAVGAGTASTLGSAMTALSTAMPYIAAAAAVLSMVKFGGGTPHSGGIAFSDGATIDTSHTASSIAANYAGGASAANGMAEASDWTRRFQAPVADALGSVAKASAASFNDILKSNGKAAGYKLGLAFSSDNDDPSRGRLSLLDAGGKEIVELQKRYSKSASAGMEQFGVDITKTLLTTLKSTDLNKLADTFLDGLNIDGLTQQAADQAMQFVAATDEIIAAFSNIGIAASAVSPELISALGGLDGAQAKLSNYYNAILTEEEKRAKVTEQLGAAFIKLDLTMPDLAAGSESAIAAFKRMVEDAASAESLATEAGRTTYVGLLEIAPAFAEIARATQPLVTASETVADTFTRSAQDIANEAANLQAQLDSLTLSPAQQISAQRATLDPSNQALFDQIQQKQASITNADWQSQLDVLAGKRTQRQVDLERDLATAADESTQTLIKQVYAQLDANDAAEITRQQNEASARAAEQLAAEQARVEEQARRAAEQAAEAAARAAEQAAEAQRRAQEQIRDGWQRAADSVIDTMRKLRGELASPEQNLAATQAQFAIATAQARAGDQTAFASLPELARSLSDLAKSNASSLIEEKRLIGTTLASLQLTLGSAASRGITVPAFDVGTNYVPRDMLAQIHEGERIVPRADNRALMDQLSGGGSGAAIAALRDEIAGLCRLFAVVQRDSGRSADSIKRLVDLWEMVTKNGQSMRTVPA